MRRLRLVSPPQLEPLTADELRARLNWGGEVSDGLVDALLREARQALDGGSGWLGRALITQTWCLDLEGFPPDGEISVPLPPLQQVTSVKYLDPDGDLITLDPSLYRVVGQGDCGAIAPVRGCYWPAARFARGNVEVEFVCGYGAAGTDVPESIRWAICLQANQLRSLTSRDQAVMIDNVIGVKSTTYAVGRDAGQGSAAISTAAEQLLSRFRVYA